jgi:hypothetical protein
MVAVKFSEAALELLRLHFSGQSLWMGADNPDSLPGHTVEETRAAYQELVSAGFMIAVDTHNHEPNARYWLTLAAMERKAEWQSAPPTSGRDGVPGRLAAPAG